MVAWQQPKWVVSWVTRIRYAERQRPAPVRSRVQGGSAQCVQTSVFVSQLNSPSRAGMVRAMAGADHWHWGEQFVPRRIGQTDRATDRCCKP